MSIYRGIYRQEDTTSEANKQSGTDLMQIIHVHISYTYNIHKLRIHAYNIYNIQYIILTLDIRY